MKMAQPRPPGRIPATTSSDAAAAQLSRLATFPIMTYKSGTSGAGISARAGRFAEKSASRSVTRDQLMEAR
jgi:hypothetical protein